ncbi:ATP-binding protein [Streptomyces sp. NPDC056682]|uniref:ATP-binding protein n=1 Tax=Streptomyces sp. NPDC056682 TaxID=3345909 RepID=UPI0036C400B0
MMTTAEPHGYEGCNVTLSAKPETAAEARRLVHQRCAKWALDPEAGETAALLVSELVTNAVKHGRSHSIRVLVARPGPDRIRVAVVDKRRCVVEAGTPHPDDVRGRGLVLVEALSDSWGTDLLPWGKRVWAEVHLRADPA